MSNPDPILSKRLLSTLNLLAEIMESNCLSSANNSNVPENSVALTEDEAKKLYKFLDELPAQLEFLEFIYFVEHLHFLDSTYVDHMKRVYLATRKRNGKPSIYSGMHWSSFVHTVMEDFPEKTRDTKSMPFKKFLKLEAQLFDAFEYSPALSKYLLKLISKEERNVTAVRKRKKSIPKSSTRKLVEKLKRQTKKFLKSNKLIAKVDMAALLIFITNMSTFAQTRDWSTAGTLSGVAAVFTSIKKKK